MASRRQKQKLESKFQPVPGGIDNGAERLKTVVRRLPPNLPEDIFWQSVRTWVSDETVSWKAYHPGKVRTKRMNKDGVPSRAYIAFKNEQQVALFSRGYDGHVFRDKAGNESQAVVEFAPFQKTPTEKRKTDARNNTIDKDEDYLSFLDALQSAKTVVSLDTLLAAAQPPPPPTTTPLLEALKAEKSAQKDKEAILRNHAHYKDAKDGARKDKEDAAKKKASAVPAKPDVPPPAKKGQKGREKEREKDNVAPTQAPDGARTQPVGTARPPPTQVPPVRHRPPKANVHPLKGDPPVRLSALIPALMSTSPPISAPASTAASASASTDASQRKPRPGLGLSRHFESALSGAVSNRKPVVPSMSILQRPADGGEAVPVIMQRAGEGVPGAGASPGASVGAGPGPGAGRGGARRGKGKGRGNRGG